MRTRVSFIAVAIFSVTSVAGCGFNSSIKFANNYDKRAQYEAEMKLAESAQSISNSLAELAEIERTIHPQKVIPSPVDADMIGMGQLASIDWSGPIAPLVKKIAQISKYKMKVLGNPPGVPILVSIAAQDTPLADILRDADFQCGDKAKIVTYPASKIIELRYVKQ